MKNSRTYQIKVLDKVLQILGLFDEKGKELKASELHEKLGLNKSTTFRILNTLAEADYLERDPRSRKYRLGFKLYFLGSLIEGPNEIRKIARPFLEDLLHKCEETVHLTVLHHGEALYLDKIDGKRSVRVVSRVGMRLPAHCSGVGKVLLAALPIESLDRIIKEKGLSRLTDNTITNEKSLKAQLARVRKQGYAIDNEEIEIGLKCIAAPITDSKGNIIAAISVAGPKDRLKEEATIIPLVMDTAAGISRALKERGFEAAFLCSEAR
ncbi:MAG: IclR family transcriptional regulator [Proteobacteria bacterium]|jgi:DNA-binding IclR family transcriptional regulator|nr:IclR family transcriptional regulator [Pseudomonadota bacterium]